MVLAETELKEVKKKLAKGERNVKRLKKKVKHSQSITARAKTANRKLFKSRKAAYLFWK